MEEFINLTTDNIENEVLCCIVRNSKKNDAVELKRSWLKDRINEGYIYRKLNTKSTVFIEYAPLEIAWTPIEGKNYYYIHCMWVDSEHKGRGYGKKLMEYVINSAKENNKSGICMLGSIKQKNWLSNQEFAKKYGFKVVDETKTGYQLLALSFDNTFPKFSEKSKKEEIDSKDLTIYYDYQCPFIYQSINKIKEYCKNNNIKLNLNFIDTLEKAKNVPSPFNNYAVFYDGKFITVNLLDEKIVDRIIKKPQN